MPSKNFSRDIKSIAITKKQGKSIKVAERTYSLTRKVLDDIENKLKTFDNE